MFNLISKQRNVWKKEGAMTCMKENKGAHIFVNACAISESLCRKLVTCLPLGKETDR